MRGCRVIVLWALSALTLLFAAPSLRAEDHDRWYVLMMQGQRAGWMHSTQKASGERITTGSEMQLKIRRGAATVEIALTSEFIETAAGKPVSGKFSMSMASMPNSAEYIFKEDEVEVISGVGAARSKSTQPLPDGEWLTPAAAADYLTKRLEAGAKEMTVRMLDISTGLRAVTTTHKVQDRTTVEALGKTVPAVKWLTTNDIQPGIESTEYVDERGVSVRSEVDFGGIKMEIILADKELAQSEIDAPELMNSTLVEPKGKIDNPRTLRKATYVLSVPNGNLGDLPSGGPQVFKRIDERSARLVVDLDAVAAADPGDEGRTEFRNPSQMINSEDELVAKLTREALGGVKDGDHEARVEAIRKFVYRHIRHKNFGVGFASAAEVAKTCTGDCSEHAALLTAMLRNAGYAARTASGLIYVDQFADREGIFGYHMWSQVLLDHDGSKKWIDLDATIPPGREFGPGGFDATHITIAVSSLSDGDSINGLVALAPLLGRLEITVE